jgi:hypothetical protein
MNTNNSSFPRPVRPKTPLDIKHLKLMTDNGEGKKATLSVGLFSNMPRFTVYTNVAADADREYGKISANMSPISWRSALDMIQMAINFKPTESDPEFKIKMDNFGTGWRDKRPLPDPILLSHFWAGKDKQGVVWIAVQAPEEKNRPRLKFSIVPDEWHAFYHKTGEQLSRSEASVLWAQSYVDCMKDLIAHMQVSHYVEPPPPKDQGGGNGGGGQGGYNRGGGGNQGGGQGGYNRGGQGGGGRPQPSDDSDIPF